jgi:UDP-N-acetylmuramate dehydrogenase
MHTGVSLSRFSSFRIGGPTDVLAEPDSVAALRGLVQYIRESDLPHLFLGAGTNILFEDGGFRGVVVRLTALRDLSVETNGADALRIAAGAGVMLPVLIGKATSLGCTGLEALWGIPGSLGGAVVMNAGAGGAALGDFLVELRLLDAAGGDLVIEKQAIHCGYRSMDLPQGAVVVQATVRLPFGESGSIETALAAAKAHRRASQPWNVPSAGCVFKNPSPQNPAGAIIDRLGFKGLAAGGAQVSEVHANFIVNRGEATAADVLKLIETIRERVRATENIELELEIQVVGEARRDV